MRSRNVYDQATWLRSGCSRRLAWVFLTALACGTGCNRTEPQADQGAAAIGLAPEVVAKHNQGVACMGQFDYEGAYRAFAELAKAHPEWHDVQIDLAIAALNRRQEGDPELTESLLSQVQQQDPQNLRAHYCEGIVALDRGDPETALKKFQHVSQADPRDAYALYYAGQCLSQLSQTEPALECFERAIDVDPYLRSAYYAAFQACLRLGQKDRANVFREQFAKLENNPQARLAEVKYTRMGSKAEVSDVLASAQEPAAVLPEGPVFAPADVLPLEGEASIAWTNSTDRPPNLTVCDLDHDGQLDLFVAGGSREPAAPNLVLRGTDNGVGSCFQWQPQHPLSSIPQVNAVAWGDFDNDGLTDVYLCRRGPNQLWRQAAAGQWQQVTDSSGTAGGDFDTRDAVFFDADHDGDLDLFLINHDGPNELLSNNLNGTFRPLAAEQGLVGQGKGSRALVAWDADADRDLDLLVINAQPPHDVFRNDRLWKYEPAPGFDTLKQAPLVAAVAVDRDANGQFELLTLQDQRLVYWQPDAQGTWQRQPEVPLDPWVGPLSCPLASCDADGDGVLDVIVTTPRGWVVLDGVSGQPRCHTDQPLATWRIMTRDAAGPSIVGCRPGLPPLLWRPGTGRFPFVALQFSGKEDRAEQMRSNRSGIGVQAAARLGSHWTSFQTLRSDSGPGQSLQPMTVGTRGAPRVDFVRMTWPDGLFQTERELAASQSHRVEETQRQVSSCPVVFVWNGQQFAFVTDVLGGGGLGFNLGRGEYSPPRPWENLLLPESLPQPHGERMEIRIAEPMEEICYLDAARLVTYDLPPGWDVVLDERFAVAGPAATGAPLYFRRECLPVRAENDRQEDVLREVSLADLQAAAPGRRDVRFIGRTAPHAITLTFAEPLDGGHACLVMDGWIEYPYSQTMFAAWQAGATYDAPTIEAQDMGGQWHVVHEQFGYPAGMPRRAALPLDRQRLPAGTRALRLTTNQEIYWDRLAIVWAEPLPDVRRQPLELLAAQVCEAGFARRATHAQQRPDYLYQQRSPLWDTRHPSGFYTSFGPALPLVRDVDDALAIMGPGEEIRLEFAAPLAAPESGWRRRWVLELHGWCKDMDLYTQDGETVAPLPQRQPQTGRSTAVRDRLHERFNQRYQAGF